MKFLDSAIAAIALGLCVSSSAATPVSGDFAVNDIGEDSESHIYTTGKLLTQL